MELGKRFKSIAIALLMHEVFRTIDGAQFGSSKAHYFSQLKGCGELEFYLFGKPQNTNQRFFPLRGTLPPPLPPTRIVFAKNRLVFKAELGSTHPLPLAEKCVAKK